MSKHSQALAGLVLTAFGGAAMAGTVSTLEEIAANGGISIDAAGDIYAANYGPVNANTGSRNVWKISPTGAFDPVIFATDINIGSGNDFDSMGNLFQSNYGGNEISKIDASGVKTTFSTEVSGPIGITIDADDNLFVSNCRGNTVSRIEPDGTASVFSSSPLFDCPNGITRDSDGNLYVINWQDGRILQLSPTGDISGFATVPSPGGHVTIAGDRLYATTYGGHQVLEFDLSTAAGLAVIGTGTAGSAGGGYTAASFDRPNGITADASGEVLYVTDATGVRKIEIEDEATSTPPPAPAPAPSPAPSSGGGGGGSFGWLCLLLLTLPLARRLRSIGR